MSPGSSFSAPSRRARRVRSTRRGRARDLEGDFAGREREVLARAGDLRVLHGQRGQREIVGRVHREIERLARVGQQQIAAGGDDLQLRRPVRRDDEPDQPSRPAPAGRRRRLDREESVRVGDGVSFEASRAGRVERARRGHGLERDGPGVGGDRDAQLAALQRLDARRIAQRACRQAGVRRRRDDDFDPGDRAAASELGRGVASPARDVDVAVTTAMSQMRPAAAAPICSRRAGNARRRSTRRDERRGVARDAIADVGFTADGRSITSVAVSTRFFEAGTRSSTSVAVRRAERGPANAPIARPASAAASRSWPRARRSRRRRHA